MRAIGRRGLSLRLKTVLIVTICVAVMARIEQRLMARSELTLTAGRVADAGRALHLAFWAPIVLGVLAGALTVFALEWLVLRRLARLSADLERIGEVHEPGAGIGVNGDDEISRLGRALNDLLRRLDAAHDRQRESDLVLRSFYDKADLLRGLVELDGDDIVHVMDNENAARFLGLPPKTTAGRRSSDLGVPAELRRVWLTHYRESDASGQPVHFEYVHGEGPAARLLSVWVCRIAVTREGRARCAYVAEDVTVERAAAENLMRAREAADQASRAKSAFLATMSHEIRTPMNGVIGMTGLLLDTPLNTVQRDYAETVKRSAESLLSLINDILDFSKIEAGKLTLDPVPFDLRVVVDDVAELLVQRAAEKGLELVVIYPPAVPRRLMGDSGRIRQILINLVGNALKFTSRGHITIEIEALALPAAPAALRVSVRDTGIGLSDAQRAGLFHMFSQADASTTRKFGGTGLGLAICKRLAELMGGEIGVDSTPGAGSTFWFTLNISQTAAHLIEPSRHPLARRRLLIVDDLAESRRVIGEEMIRLGAHVENVGSGPAALARLMAEPEGRIPFDAMLIDLNLPGMDGAALGRAVAADATLAAIPRILLTSSPAQGDAQHFQEAGFVAYLVKPVRAGVLAAVLERVLATSAQARGGILTRHTLLDGRAGPQSARRLALRFPGLRLLLAEDNVVNQKVATRMLERLGCTVEIADNGREAVEKAGRTPFDLIFMDVHMPDLDGLAASAVIRAGEAAGRRVPIVALTANAMESDRERCLAAGMDGYVSKPMKIDDLVAALTQWCGAPVEINGADAASADGRRAAA